jgi:hypothetical protein
MKVELREFEHTRYLLVICQDALDQALFSHLPTGARLEAEVCQSDDYGETYLRIKLDSEAEPPE